MRIEEVDWDLNIREHKIGRYSVLNYAYCLMLLRSTVVPPNTAPTLTASHQYRC